MSVDLDHRDWAVDKDWLILRPPDGGGELRIDVYDYGKLPTLNQLRALAQNRLPTGTEMVDAVCGQFVGFTYEYFDKDDAFWHEWHLTLADTVLFITFTCDRGREDQYREEVNVILSTLKDGRP